MQLGEAIATYDVALALQGESGKFEVTSPTGEAYQVTCNPNHSISSLEWSGNQAGSAPFLVRKVAEPVLQESGKGVEAASAASAVQTRTNPAPFLLENQGGETVSASNKETVAVPSKNVNRESENSAMADIDLVFVETDPATELPTAGVCIQNAQGPTEQWITHRCSTLNEFDAEIRRLHSQLDAIRYRARKKFFQATRAFAAGA